MKKEAKTKEPNLEKIASEVRTAVLKLNDALLKAKEAKLRVLIYEIGHSDKVRINQYSDLFVSDIHQEISF